MLHGSVPRFVIQRVHQGLVMLHGSVPGFVIQRVRVRVW